MGERYFYAFVRQDLPETQRIIQTAHAAYEMALRLPAFSDKIPSSMVLFQVEDESALIDVAEYLDTYIPGQYHMFYEPDAFWGQEERGDVGWSAIATAPFAKDSPLRDLFSHFKLYGRETESGG